MAGSKNAFPINNMPSNMGVKSLFAVLVFFLSLQLIPQFLAVRASKVSGNETDRLALLQLKSKITHDPFGALGSWNESIHFCQWNGVTCSRRHQRVSILDLRSLDLAGSISPYIGNFSFLKQLNLENNSFTHEIPSEISHLRRLKLLALNNNSISGEIPANISSNLIGINLAVNQLVGNIPSEFGSLSKIVELLATDNKLTGTMPSSLGNLSFINSLSLSSNNLIGSIPDSFGRLKNLVSLYLGRNRLSGSIPSSIFNISSIEIFDVGFNPIQWNIPLDLALTLPNLRLLSILGNQITGAIPPFLSNATRLEIFQASYTNLTGEVPNLGKLQMLSKFLIRNNNLGSGGHADLNFLCSLTNATSLQLLAIDGNNFGGPLHGCIANLSSSLAMLVLANNTITGSIPSGIGKLFNLQMLALSDNQFSGTIPPTIGELQNLGKLLLYRNRLSGNIPSSIGNLKMLIHLKMNDNFLQGSIPSSIGKCESLLLINLNNNNLCGTIPPQLIRLSSLSITLDLSRNRLIGYLPAEIGKLKNLGILNVSWNSLSGDIPSSLGSCTSLEQLYMQGNLFQSSIPSSLRYLRGLRVLDLSQNNISGAIPDFLSQFKFLEKLNLSYNDLDGVVPSVGVFKNASATSLLGNSKLCGGISEFQLPTCASEKSKGRRLTLAPKLVIAIVSSLVGITLTVSFVFLCCVRKKKDKPNQSKSINSLMFLSYQNLYNATNGFSSANLIGSGSIGSVYKGIIDEGINIVAVKVFKLLHRGASKSFIAECSALKNTRHRNLVKVLTACSGVDYQGNDFKALVYEFMPNGSLEEWLHPVAEDDEIDEAPRNLNLLQRLNISIDVACALDYLHHDCQPPIAHCDLKPNNVLLDDEMTAHVGDFGLATFLPPTHEQTSSIGVKGSVGYIAPEYGLGSEVSINGDVYSYGILLLELVTRKKPTNIMFEGDLNLHSFASMALPDHVMDIVDPILLNNDGDLVGNDNKKRRDATINSRIECLTSMIRIGVACSMESPQDRINITNAVHELQSIKKVLLEAGNLFNRKRVLHITGQQSKKLHQVDESKI